MIDAIQSPVTGGRLLGATSSSSPISPFGDTCRHGEKSYGIPCLIDKGLSVRLHEDL